MKTKRWLLLVGLLALLALAVVPVLAETSGTYDLSWWTVDGGGVNNATSGDYTLSGTAGQPDVGANSSGDYDLAGGFWAGIMSTLRNFLPLIEK